MSSPWATSVDGKLSLQTATMLETIVIICVKFSLSDGDGVGVLTAESTLWMAYTMASVCASRYGYMALASVRTSERYQLRRTHPEFQPRFFRALRRRRVIAHDTGTVWRRLVKDGWW